MKSLFKIILAVVVSVTVTSCFNKKDRNYQYFPNMYESVAYEPYGSYDNEYFENTQAAMLPVEGTIARGHSLYSYENSTEGLASAKAGLTNPLPYTEDNVNKGKELYTIYCAICHGDKGDGKGNLAQREKILGVPAYNDPGRAITEGSVYHVTYYGLNTMGSYASQTNEKERWQINHYVMDLKRQLEGAPKREFVSEEDVQAVADSLRMQKDMMVEEVENETSPANETTENHSSEEEH
ncbi:cytochrome c [Mesonia sp. K7]|uniref:c-type cytochrome n=1 Tax=Mesonia sp. K7 TaxID=2218606 RepID=UPI000DA98024|nr:cytochrome c [Mesonia sp. K7]PZD78772.1 cytochrome c [Mesonia sp. K7]